MFYQHPVGLKNELIRRRIRTFADYRSKPEQSSFEKTFYYNARVSVPKKCLIGSCFGIYCGSKSAPLEQQYGEQRDHNQALQ